mmetsp:Transcript_25772/g.56543  ORF Transcript_25772/g.56543 Transcript_25772/m.56543 type:complete len:231 (-) Transcript_25772:1287-1979(-)
MIVTRHLFLKMISERIAQCICYWFWIDLVARSRFHPKSIGRGRNGGRDLTITEVCHSLNRNRQVAPTKFRCSTLHITLKFKPCHNAMISSIFIKNLIIRIYCYDKRRICPLRIPPAETHPIHAYFFWISRGRDDLPTRTHAETVCTTTIAIHSVHCLICGQSVRWRGHLSNVLRLSSKKFFVFCIGQTLTSFDGRPPFITILDFVYYSLGMFNSKADSKPLGFQFYTRPV